ncbi:MAG: hypothetical protein LBK43_04390 [Treponema sp.]|nr:hypothetical protein [Treponema sp.]
MAVASTVSTGSEEDSGIRVSFGTESGAFTFACGMRRTGIEGAGAGTVAAFAAGTRTGLDAGTAGDTGGAGCGAGAGVTATFAAGTRTGSGGEAGTEGDT